MKDIVANDRVATSSRIKVKKEKIVVEEKQRGLLRYMFDLIANWILIATLISIDFALFASSGNNNLFSSAFDLSSAAWYVFLGIAVVSFVLIFAVSFSRVLQNAVTAVFVGVFIVMMFSHFTLFDETAFLSVLTRSFSSMASHVIFAIVIAFSCFVFLCFSSKSNISYLAGTVIVVFSWILFKAHINAARVQEEFVVVYDQKVSNVDEKPKKFVYLAFPNLASYSYIKDIDEAGISREKVAKTADIMLAFYAKNNFAIYPNAYVSNLNSFDNMIKTLNMSSDDNVKPFLMSGISIDGYWKFDNINEKYFYLKDNRLFDTFKKSKYDLSAYQTRELDFCRQNDQFIVNKCVDKVNMPANVKDLNISDSKRARVLFFQWLETANLINDSSMFHGFLKTLFGGDSTPIAGMSYKKLYPVNAFKTLDIMAEDIVNDKQNRAYFAVVDLPSDTFIYNEYCQVKPVDMWSGVNDTNKAALNNTPNKKSAYLDQVACLYGKLEEFMNKLENKGVADNTVIVLQGLSAVDKLNTGQVNFIKEFKGKNLVNMAIRDPLKKEFKINMEMCKTEEILKYYLYKKGNCSNLVDIGLQDESKKELKKALMMQVTNRQALVNAVKSFMEWYKGWLKLNNPVLWEATENKKTDWVDDIERIDVKHIEIVDTPETVELIAEEETVEAVEETVEAPAVEEKAEVVDTTAVVAAPVVPEAATDVLGREAPVENVSVSEEAGVAELRQDTAEENVMSFDEYEKENPVADEVEDVDGNVLEDVSDASSADFWSGNNQDVSSAQESAVQRQNNPSVPQLFDTPRQVGNTGSPVHLIELPDEEDDLSDSELQGILDKVFEPSNVPVTNNVPVL